MTEQLALIQTPASAPKLTDRQATALNHLTAAGGDGLTADEVGAILHQAKPASERGHHTAETRCLYCGKTGREVLLALKAKGLARYRRGKGALAGAWLSADAPAAPARSVRGMLTDDQPIPF